MNIQDPNTAVIIVYYKSHHEIIHCIEGIASQRSKKSIFIFLNSPIPLDVYNKIKKFDPTIYPYTANIGFGAAVNYCIEHINWALFSFGLIVNPDILMLDNSVLSNLIKTSRTYNDNVILSPMHYSCGNQNELDPKFLNYLSKSKKTPSSFVFEVPFVNAAFWLLSKNVIKQVGGFDPIFFLYGEDQNYVFRASSFGIKVLIDKQTRVLHCRSSKIPSSEKYFQDLRGYAWHSIIISQLNYIMTFAMFAKIITKNLIVHPQFFLKICEVLLLTLLNFNKLVTRKNEYSKGAFLS